MERGRKEVRAEMREGRERERRRMKREREGEGGREREESAKRVREGSRVRKRASVVTWPPIFQVSSHL